MKRLHTIIATLACAILSIPGCALREYESRMDDQRRRLDIFDEENRYIGSNWIDMPMVDSEKKKGAKVPAWPFDVLLRLPKEVFTAPAPTVYQSPAQDLRLFRYGSTAAGYNFFVAAGLIPIR
jgi:hypothetical protein